MDANWEWLDRLSGPLDTDFIDAVGERVADKERPELEQPFGTASCKSSARGLVGLVPTGTPPIAESYPPPP